MSLSFLHIEYVSRSCVSCVSGCLSSLFLVSFSFCSPYLELVLLVFGSLVKGPVISEPPDVIELVEAFDVVRHSISLQHFLTLWDGGYSVDLQIWKHRKLRKAQENILVGTKTIPGAEMCKLQYFLPRNITHATSFCAH